MAIKIEEESNNDNKIVDEQFQKSKQGSWIVNKLESYFYWHGKKVAQWPVTVIVICLIISGICMSGLLNYKSEGNPYKLWIPKDSDFVKNTDWLWNHYPPNTRFHSVIVTAPNVLNPDVIGYMLKIHQKMANLQSPEGLTWTDKCYKVDVVDTRGIKLKSNVEPSVAYYPRIYCKIVKKISSPTCLETSIVELWASDGYNSTQTEMAVFNLTQKSILDAINTKNSSGIFLYDKDFTSMLGGIKRNSTGHIVSATAATINFFGGVNTDDITDEDRRRNNYGAPVDQGTLDFEISILNMLNEASIEAPPGVLIDFNVARSFSDEASKAVNSDVVGFVIGFSVVYIYVLIMLGGFGCVQQKTTLGSMGLMSVLLSVLSSYGICSTIGLVFSPMHPMIPFLILGIGIDDMFVIVQCLSNFEDSDPKFADKTIDLLVGETLKHAGVAITITSLTDLVVFAVGAITDLPALQSFCLYCAVGIFLVYIFQATFFTAFLALDLRRIRANRNSFLPCIKHKKSDDSEDSTDALGHQIGWRKNPGKIFFRKYGEILMHPISKTLVICLTIGLTGVGIYGLTELQQEFDAAWFLPPNSYLGDWIKANREFFPTSGSRVKINIDNIDYDEFWKLSSLVEDLEAQDDIVSSVDSWWSKFMEYVEEYDLLTLDFVSGFKINDASEMIVLYNHTEFYFRLTQFLYSSKGIQYQKNFKFDSVLNCGTISPKIKLTEIEFTHRLFSGSAEHVPAMIKIKEIVNSYNFSSHAFAIAHEYAGWETDQVIAEETYRNIGISMLCVLISSGILLAHFKSFTLVFLCVLLSIVDVAGFMHFWNLTIDVISCINLVIAVGLCVDYAAHIAHTFMITPGENGDKRAIQTLADIGPAVMNGGFSTFLAFITTCASESHVFLTFFKIFFLVVAFGLYHGLVVLPVLLSVLEIPCGRRRKPNKIEPADVSSISNKKTESVTGISWRPQPNSLDMSYDIKL